MSPQEAFFAALLGVSTIYHLLGMGLLIKRRSVFPVSGREVILVLGFAIGTLTSDIELCLEGFVANVPCRWRLFTSVYTALLGLNSLCARLCRLWFLYYLAQERLKNYYHKGDKQSTWFSQRRLWTTPKYLVGFFLAISVVEAVTLELIYMLIPDSDDCDSLKTVSIGVYVLEAFTVLAVVGTAYRIRNVQDGYLIQREMKLLMYAGIVYIPFVFLHATPDAVDQQFPVSNLILILVGFAFTGVTIYFPVYKSYYPDMKKKRRRSQLTRSSRELSKSVPALIEILTRPEHERFAKDFEDHLTREFSVESILFFRSAHAFESLEAENLSDVALAGRAMRIWYAYFDDNSENLINIPHDIRNAILDHLKLKIPNFDKLSEQSANTQAIRTNGRIDLNIFLPAKNNIYTLMNTDPYRRWSGKYVVASRRDTIDARKSAKSVSSMCRIDVRPAAEKDGVDSAADDECSSSDEVVKDPKQSFQIHSIVGRSSAPSIEPNGASVKPSQIV